MNVTIVQLKEVLQMFKDDREKFSNLLTLKAHPEQREIHIKSLKHYEKEIIRMEKKIANYPL